MMNRVLLVAAVGAVAMSAGACAHTPQTTLSCPNLDNPDSLRIAAKDTNLHEYANPGHSRRGGPDGGIDLGKAPHRAVLVFEDNLGATQVGPNGEIAPDTKSTRYNYGQLAKGQIIAEVWLAASFQADLTDGNSLKLPADTSYIAACVPTGPTGKEPADGTDIKALVIPADQTEPVDTISGKYFRTRQEQYGKRAWAFWSSSSKSGMCIACGHGWCQF